MLFENRNQQYKTCFYLMILMLTAIAFITAMVSRWLTKPIVQLSKATKQFANGNLEKRVTLNGEDELALLSKDFNVMAEKLQQMMDDCRAQGLSPLICSSYRTNKKQERLFNNQIESYKAKGYSDENARKEAAKWVAIPGTSEHQLGLSVDIVSLGNQRLDESQEKTEEQQWLMKNCYKYGFILRYPTDKNEITGIGYEPWHYRYVGKGAAAEIMQKGITLEEYLSDL